MRADLRGQRIPGIRRHRQQRGELRHRRGQQARVRTGRRHDPPADPGQLVLWFGQQQPAQCAKRLIDWVEFQVAPVGIGLACHEPAIAARHHRPQLIGQHRLPDPWRPADQYPTAPACQGILERRAQRRHLAVAPHQPRRRQQPQRNVLLADLQCGHARPRLVLPQPFQVMDQAVSRLVAVIRLLLQQMHDDL